MFPITVKYSTFARFQADVGIHGNNEADTAAKSALEFEIVKFKIPSTDLKHFIKLYINSLWQIFWDFCDTSKLYSIQNKVNIPYNFNLKRSDQVVISRIRIGHSKLTHTYLLKGEQQPECIFCDCPLTLHHIFLECPDTLPARNSLLNNVQTMQDLFTQVNISDILQFLQECDFYNKIYFFFYTFIFFIILILKFYARRMGR